MNNFQTQAIEQIDARLKDQLAVKTPLKYSEVKAAGRQGAVEKIWILLGGDAASKPGDVYYTANFQANAHCFTIYIYPDEIGIDIDGHDWRICEKYDFNSPEELIRDFTEKLSTIISEPQ